MKKILSTLLLTLVLFLGICLSVNVTAATGDVYNIVTCPGEDMATQMQINFQSKTTISDLKVEYTVASDTNYANAVSVDAISRVFSRQDNDPVKGAQYNGFSTPRNIWNALLDGLTPNTKYIYRITDGSKVYASDYAFQTGSTTDDEFSFMFMTDPQYYSESGASKFNIMTEAQLKNYDLKFTFITGDISDKGGDSSYWDMLYTKSSLKKLTFATTVGNHEYYDKATVTTDNVIYNQFFYNPQNGPEHVKGSSYYFIYNQALFIMLDSEERNNLEEQQEWFRNVCNTVHCSYIIVGTHKSSYAGAEYASDGKLFISKWGSIFDECKVDLVLSGHDHMYARTKPLVNGEIVSEKYSGTTYILGGSAGDKYYNKKSDDNLELWDCWFQRTTCCSIITLGKEKLKVETYDIGGKLQDECSLDRKRFGTINPNFSKEEFEKSFTVENAMPDLTSGKISWSEDGYGYVQSITCTNVTSGERIGSTPFMNNATTKLEVDGKFWIGEINKIKVDIIYKDGSTKSLELELDNNIDWGKINDVKVIDITSTTFKIVLKLDLNKDVNYIDRFRLVENGSIKKNYFLKDGDLEKEELIIELSNKLMKPSTTHTYEVQAMNVNGTIIWSETIEVTSLREMTPEEIYQNDMASITFKSMIDNLLKALGAE